MRTSTIVLAFACTVVAVLFAPRPCAAWKPYTHNQTGEQARLDATDDGKVTIAGRDYPVRAEVVAALQAWPEYFDAGVIGPDGFPDVTYGQAVIHSSKTGEWFGHIYAKAWEAQSNPAYSSDQKAQILAFSYGYLTHGAGDMWAHTLVNDFSDPSHTRGVFPTVPEILTSVEMAAIAVRHLIVEGYIGDATPGFDGNPERGPAPGGDVSDDSTPSHAYAVPNDFLYETLINPETVTPIPAIRGKYAEARGPLIGFFLEMREDLRDFANGNPDPLADAISAYDDTIEDLMALSEACDFDDILDVIECPAGLLLLGFDVVIDSFEAFLTFVAETTVLLAKDVLNAYIGAWIDDIDDGLRHWNEFGLASTRGLFDPQARRDLQNDECQFKGDESTLLRSDCEDGIRTLDVVLHEVDPFVNDHLLSMIGLPDFVGRVSEILGVISDIVDDILGVLGIPFNPLLEARAQIKEFINELIEDAIADVLGIDIAALEDFIKEPHRFVCRDETPFTLPDPLGAVTLPLFPAGEHDRLDGILHIPPAHHIPELGLPEDCGRFPDNVTFDVNQFAPYRNTITMAKLLLLDGPEVNHVLTDILGRTIDTYSPGQNIMIHGLHTGTTWLRLIDGDHAWRQDGAPVFSSRREEITAGTGEFPIWESCVLRPAFRTLFQDWENGTQSFPDYEDHESADPTNDPNPPASALARTGEFYDDGLHQFVAADNVFTHTAHDYPAGKAFLDDELELQHRVFLDGTVPAAFTTTGQLATFSLSGPDGPYHVEVRSADHCHTFAEDDALAPEPIQASEFVLDASPPVMTCATPPFGLVFDSDDLSAVNYAISDGPLGSGLASSSSVLDGYTTATGTLAVAPGVVLDMFLLYPGTRTVAVSATDHLGNSGVSSCTFEIHPTAASMLNNLDRAFAQGLLKNKGMHTSLGAKLRAADKAQKRGQPNTAANVIDALLHELKAQRGKGVEQVFSDRFIAFANDLILELERSSGHVIRLHEIEEVVRATSPKFP